MSKVGDVLRALWPDSIPASDYETAVELAKTASDVAAAVGTVEAERARRNWVEKNRWVEPSPRPPLTTDPNKLTTKQAAKFLGKGIEFIWKATRSGRLKAEKIGKGPRPANLFAKSELEAFKKTLKP